jgi:peptide/nickel transport system substrate-binding protein
MPDPQRNAEAFAADLEGVGFRVTLRSAPWSPDYLAGAQSGHYQLYLFGWIADFPDPADFLDVHFGALNPQFGLRDPALFSLLRRADATVQRQVRTRLYDQASIEVMKELPMVPYVWAGSAVVFTRDVKGFVPSPIGSSAEPFAALHFG